MEESINILVVDDSAEDLYVLKRLLNYSESKYDITTCASGTECLVALQQNRFDCAIVDYMLPDYNGIDLIQKIQKHNPSPPAFIMLTGVGDEEIAVQAMKQGAHDYLVKDHLTQATINKSIHAALDKQQLEQDLAQSQSHNRELERQLRLVVERAPIALYKFDRDGYIIMAHGNAFELLGLDSAEIVGKHHRDVLPLDWNLDELLANAAEGTEETQITHYNKRIVRSHFFPAENGETFGVSYDITEYHQSIERERELVDLRGKFFERASHEFRTPLAVILSSAEILHQYWQKLKVDRREQHLDRISSQVLLMETMLDEVTYLQHFDENIFDHSSQTVHLNPILKTAAEHFGNARIIVNIPESDTVVSGNPGLLKQMFESILDNAIKYSDDGSPIEVNVYCQANEIVITITDSGIGIPPEDIPHLFEPFHRAQNSIAYTGTGLGLSIVKHIINVHNGHIEVDSVLNEGTQVTITLSKP